MDARFRGQQRERKAEPEGRREPSWLEILFPKVLPLMPLTRFPGFVWLIAVGFGYPAQRPDEGKGRGVVVAVPVSAATSAGRRA
jgi:hypothetical protein